MGQNGHLECRGLYFFYGKLNEYHQWGKDAVHQRVVPTVKRVDFVSD